MLTLHWQQKVSGPLPISCIHLPTIANRLQLVHLALWAELARADWSFKAGHLKDRGISQSNGQSFTTAAKKRLMPCFPLALLLAANFATLQTLLLSPSPCSCF